MVVVGVGTVGSQIAYELARSGVGGLCLIDGDHVELPNLARHVLPRQYIGMNKAEAMALFLSTEIPSSKVTALARKIDDSMSAKAVDHLLKDADAVVVATDDHNTQRRVAQRARALDLPAVLPALYDDGGGEVFVQRSSRSPCFFCWDGYRSVDDGLRGVTALNADTLAVLQLAVHLTIGILDPLSTYARLMIAHDDPRPLQVFIQRPLAALRMAPQQRRADCPYCAIGPVRLLSTPELQSRRGPPVSEVEARTNAWRTLARVLSTLAVLAVICYVVITTRIHEDTVAGLVAMIVILISLWVLYANTTDLIDAWNEYRTVRRQNRNE